MLIRAATPGDIPALIPLWKKMLDHHSTFHEMYEYPGDTDGSFASCISDYIGKTETQLFVAVDEQQVIGYIQVRKMNRPAIFKLKQKGSIDGLFVDEVYRKKNAGKQLLDEALTWLQGVSYIELQVVNDNDMARSFWTNNGFERVAECYARKVES